LKRDFEFAISEFRHASVDIVFVVDSDVFVLAEFADEVLVKAELLLLMSYLFGDVCPSSLITVGIGSVVQLVVHHFVRLTLLGILDFLQHVALAHGVHNF